MIVTWPQTGTGRYMETNEMPTPNAISPMETTILEAGSILQDRYEVLGLRALGGMGAIYEAKDRRFTHTIRRCAIKEIINSAPDAKTQHLNLRYFEREANVLASLSHPAIPHIFDYFSLGNRAYLVLEYIDGEDLESVLEHTSDPLPEKRVLRWALQVCDVLHFLHSTPSGPIVFRDIKPSNIMLCENERIVLVDFGIAKAFADQKKGTMVGTEGYSPPEQYRGLAGPHGDIYALGATLHHLLTRQDPRLQPPFTFHERPIRSANPAISRATEELVSKCLEYEAEKRFPTVTELKAAILAALGENETSIPDTLFSPKPDVRDRLVWEFACEDEIRSSPTVSKNVLYIGAYDNNLYAIDASDGSFLWKYPTGAGICATPCTDSDRILFGSEDQILYALSERTGRIAWSCPTDGQIRSSAMATYGHIFFGSDDGCVYAANIDSGQVIWKFQTGGPVRCRPLLVDESIVFGSEDGQIYAVDMGSSELRWRQRASRGIISSPCRGDGLIYAGSRDWHMYAFSARSGWPVWRFRTNNVVISSPATADNAVFFGSVDTHVYALDAKNGRVIWKVPTDKQVVSSPTVHEGRVYIGSVDTHVYCFEAKTGDQIWRYKASGPITSSPTIVEGILYIGSLDGRIYALSL